MYMYAKYKESKEKCFSLNINRVDVNDQSLHCVHSVSNSNTGDVDKCDTTVVFLYLTVSHRLSHLNSCI